MSPPQTADAGAIPNTAGKTDPKASPAVPLVLLTAGKKVNPNELEQLRAKDRKPKRSGLRPISSLTAIQLGQLQESLARAVPEDGADDSENASPEVNEK